MNRVADNSSVEGRWRVGSLWVKIWFQNRRSKYKKIMKQGGTPPGPPLGNPGQGGQPPNPSLSMGGSAPSPNGMPPQHTPPHPQHVQGGGGGPHPPHTPHQQQLSPPGEMPPQSVTPHGMVVAPPGGVTSVQHGPPPSSTPLLPVSAAPMSPPQVSWSEMQQHVAQNPYMSPYASWYPQPGVAPVHMNSAC
ncbi:hypothetical protein ACOMHN_023653 [Nucella lapillus]